VASGYHANVCRHDNACRHLEIFLKDKNFFEKITICRFLNLDEIWAKLQKQVLQGPMLVDTIIKDCTVIR
jgi:hypothetical protein